MSRTPLDDLEDSLRWTSTHVGAPGCQVRNDAAMQLVALQALRSEAASAAEFIAAGYDPEDEPPIVKGALDAQADAEREVFRLRELLRSGHDAGCASGNCRRCSDELAIVQLEKELSALRAESIALSAAARNCAVLALEQIHHVSACDCVRCRICRGMLEAGL